ncbi:MAG: FAD-dependent oxidoreductase [Alphaproteobacteria bacterium]|nr:FAD-dependent oxidoreductase [Alphaproteobacteria bacterium]
MINKKKTLILKTFFLFYCLMPMYEARAVKIISGECIELIQTSVRKQLARILQNNQPPKERKPIKVMGAGVAGLTAAYELNKLGHPVEIIEASSRVGGRIWTHTFSSTGQYGELGAMRIPASHDYTHHYIDLAGLSDSLRPFITAHQNPNCFYQLRGKTLRMRDAANFIKNEYRLSSYEQAILANNPPPEILQRHLSNALQRLHSRNKDSTDGPDKEEEWGGLLGTTFLNDDALSLEKLSLGEFLRQRVESRDAQELIGVTTGLELWWDKAVSMFLREGITQTGEGLEEIAGGFSKLPNALAHMLRENSVNIRLNTEVVSIELPPHSNQKIKFKTRPTDPSKWDSPPADLPVEDETADYVICTIPFGVLRTMEVKGFSPIKMEAIRNLSYASSTKVLLHFTDRFWERGSPEERIIGGASMSDQITRSTYYPSDHAKIIPSLTPRNQKQFRGVFTVSDPLIVESKTVLSVDHPVPGVLLGSYNWGQDALRLGQLPPKERADVVITELEKIHPELPKYLHPTERHMSMSWDSYRWSKGAFCGIRPNDMRDYYYASKKPEGNFYFAGEHCSLDPGWIQGAIKSGLDAVEELAKSRLN